MARKKEDKQPSGAPEWMVTYGDMMTLLLCFFVILVAMSEIKEEKKVQEVLRSVAQALGAHPMAEASVPGQSPANSLWRQIQTLGGQSTRTRRADTSTRAVSGQWRRVRKIRDGLHLTIGGPAMFPEGSAELTDALKEELDEVIQVVRGKPNKLIVQGHATRKPLPSGSSFADHWDLGYARAKAVMGYLVEVGRIDRRRIRIGSAGSEEPVRETRQDSLRAANRRVDIFVTESYVRDYVGGTIGSPEAPPEDLDAVDRPGSDTGPSQADEIEEGTAPE